MLEQATEYPFDEELTHEASTLRELRFKVTDEDVGKQITEVLSLYDGKKKELAGEAKANQQAQAAQEAQAAQTAQARNDSISAAQLLQSEEEKKTMMWIGGGIGALILLFMGGKQVMQMINQNKLQKQQKAMMENMMNMAQKQTGGMTQIPRMSGMSNIPGMEGASDLTAIIPSVNDVIKESTSKVQQPARTMSKEAEAAKQKLMQLKASQQQGTGDKGQGAGSKEQGAKPRPSLNDAIPATFKRLAKRKSSSDNNNHAPI